MAALCFSPYCSGRHTQFEATSIGRCDDFSKTSIAQPTSNSRLLMIVSWPHMKGQNEPSQSACDSGWSSCRIVRGDDDRRRLARRKNAEPAPATFAEPSPLVPGAKVVTLWPTDRPRQKRWRDTISPRTSTCLVATAARAGCHQHSQSINRASSGAARQSQWHGGDPCRRRRETRR